MEVLFYVLLMLHILGAICGLGATFASPFIMKGATTVSTAKYALAVNAKVDKLAKVGSITLLITGIIMGVLHPSLFITPWYLISIILYILIQPVVAYLLPKHAKTMVVILEGVTSEELPDTYSKVAKKKLPLSLLAQIVVLILVYFMVFKPF